jgi:TolB-like protein/DNA-binding winged helix-turn-helix (wHTH) protein
LATPKTAHEIRFSEYSLDLRIPELRRNGTVLRLQPQPAKLLAILASRAGEVVTRQELADQVWGSETYVDFEHGLNYAIQQIRSVLEDDPKDPHFVETIPKKGYRFVAPLTNRPDVVESGAAEIAPVTTESLHKPTSRSRYWYFGLGAIVLLAAGLVIARTYLRPRSVGTARIQSLAVLPLRNLSNDPTQEYFSDGMTDELITDLANSESLRVISHTSVERYKATKLSLPQIARELGELDAVVEGTVLRSGDRVRITAQLIDGHSDQHLWAESYERDVRDVLALQSEVAQDIARQVSTKLSPPQQERLWTARGVSPEAHEAYLKGIFDASKLTPEGLQSGIGHFDDAIRLDSQYAPAYAGKSEAYGWAAGLSILPSDDVLPKARDAALKALQLDDTLSQAHHSMGWVNYALDWNFAAAEAQFKRAIELNRNDVTAHLWYGMFLAQRGRVNESLEEMKHAEQLDPISLMTNALSATPYLVARNYDAAIAKANQVLLMDPASGVGHWILLTAYEGKGDYSKAIEEREKMLVLWGQSPENAAQQTSQLKKAFAATKALGYWQARLGSLGPDANADPYELAVVLARLGQKERAVASLQKSSAARSTELLYWAQSEPAFDSLRSDPRFQALLPRSASTLH